MNYITTGTNSVKHKTVKRVSISIEVNYKNYDYSIKRR